MNESMKEYGLQAVRLWRDFVCPEGHVTDQTHTARHDAPLCPVCGLKMVYIGRPRGDEDLNPREEAHKVFLRDIKKLLKRYNIGRGVDINLECDAYGYAGYVVIGSTVRRSRIRIQLAGKDNAAILRSIVLRVDEYAKR